MTWPEAIFNMVFAVCVTLIILAWISWMKERR
jgi:hypothetical protein